MEYEELNYEGTKNTKTKMKGRDVARDAINPVSDCLPFKVSSIHSA